MSLHKHLKIFYIFMSLHLKDVRKIFEEKNPINSQKKQSLIAAKRISKDLQKIFEDH